MKQTINITQFHDAFSRMGRVNNFSYDARVMLYDFFLEIEADLEEEFELDVIAVCCDYIEETFEETVSAYDIELTLGSDELEETVLEYLEANTCVVGRTDKGTVIYQQF